MLVCVSSARCYGFSRDDGPLSPVGSLPKSRCKRIPLCQPGSPVHRRVIRQTANICRRRPEQSTCRSPVVFFRGTDRDRLCLSGCNAWSSGTCHHSRTRGDRWGPQLWQGRGVATSVPGARRHSHHPRWEVLLSEWPVCNRIDDDDARGSFEYSKSGNDRTHVDVRVFISSLARCEMTERCNF